MISTRIPRELAGLALVLGVLLAAGKLIALQLEVEERTQPLGKVRAADLVKIELESGEQALCLEKTEGRWRLTSPSESDADLAKVNALVAGLFSLRAGKAVSTDPMQYPHYGLAETRVHVKVYSRRRSRPVLDANFGEEALGSDSHYFRFARDTPVYIATGLESSSLKLDPEIYRDKFASASPVEPVQN